MLKQFYLGDWQVEPASNTLILGKTKRAIEPKAMDVLLLLCQQAGEVVSADDIVAQCWPDSPVGDNPIHKTITQLRKALGDKASAPSFIETIRKRGYRVIADVQFLEDEQTRAAETDWQGQSPFPGLTAFTQQESQVYYGRNAAVKNLLARLSDQFTKKRPLTLIIGPSGSGKSSLVHAGLLPRLLNNKGANGVHAIDYASIDIADVQAAHIVEELAACMLDWDINDAPLFEGESADSLAAKLKGDPKSVINIAKAKLTTASQYNNVAFPCYVIVLDRLEAYLATNHVDSAHKQAVFTLLETLAESGFILMLLVCRNDFYHHLAAYPTLMKNKERGAHFDLTPPSASELSQMIRLPAIAAGLEWEEDSNTDVTLDDIILTDAAAEPNCLPLLQYTLQELYLQRTDNLLQVSTYKQLGGIEGAIGHKAEQLYLQMSALVKTALDRVLPLIVTLTQDGSNLTSRTAFWSELSNDNEKKFVELMVEHRLFVSQLYQDKACFKVAHEAVLRRWQRVQDWIQQHQSALVSKGRLEQQTRQWLQDNKSKAFLLTEGKPLMDALALKGDTSLSLSQDELALIKASQKTAQRKRIIRGITFAALACLTVISFGAMLQSQQSQQLAERKRVEAENLMGFMIGDFADKLRSVKRMDLLEGISEQALTYVEAAQEDNTRWFGSTGPEPSFELRFQHALSLQALAEVRYYRDDADTAKKLYEQAHRGLETLHKEQPNNFELLKTAGANAFWLGNIAFEAHDFNLADKQLKRYLTFSEKMLRLEPDNDTALMEVSYATNSMGSVAFRQLEFAQALSYFESSLAYKQRILEKSGESISSVTAVTNSYSWIASTLMNLGNINDAVRTLENAEGILSKQLSFTPGNASIIENLSFVKVKIAESGRFAKDMTKPVEKLKEAQSLLSNILAQDPDNSIWKSQYLNIGTMLNYYQSQTFSSSNINKAGLNISIDDILDENYFVTAKGYATHSFQNLGKWEFSKRLLNSLEKTESMSDNINAAIHANILNIENLKKYIPYQLANIRQSLHENSHDINTVRTKCEDLFTLTSKVVRQSQHPLFLQAYVFSGYCLNKQNAVNEQRAQLFRMNVPLPHYFTIINKELINDNTTQL
jgi:DNA-binding winged helix-turn-helix (wHTH) protein/tetratricopeptide (TPR) repeat protein